MRPAQNRRVRGRSNRKGPNPLTRSYESNGPDVKIRGTAQHVAEKYTQLARDAQVAGDPVACENHLQHAEHYFRIIAAAQTQFQQAYGAPPRGYDDGDEGDLDDEYAMDDAPQRLPQGAAPGDEAYPVGIPQPGQSAPAGYRERQDRPQRNDRYERPDRPDRPERQDRPDRPERQERSERHERPARVERPVRVSPDVPEGQPIRQDGEREQRGGRRERFRRDRDVRDVRPAPREPDVAGDEAEVTGGLPAFLTTPLRPPAPAPAPAPVVAPVENVAPASVSAHDMADDVDHGSATVQSTDEAGGEEGGDRFPVRARRRRGRTRTDGPADEIDVEQTAAG